MKTLVIAYLAFGLLASGIPDVGVFVCLASMIIATLFALFEVLNYTSNKVVDKDLPKELIAKK